jgi:GAF domain
VSSYSNLELAFFQQLLANAFTVQECGMDRQSLAGIVELQRSIQESSLGEQGMMQLIAERTRGVASASGVAIGLLNRDHLFYAAGTGTAVSYVGMRVKAALTVSRMNEDRAEILRVENADVDPRIEAAVCRQFHAKSLLILPLYRGRVLAGVLHILFEEPHTFEDQELRTYRILAGLLSEALFQQVSPEQARAASGKLSAARALIEQKVAVERRPVTASPVPIVATALDAVAKDQPVTLAPAEREEVVVEGLPSSAILAFWRQCLPLYRRAHISELAVATVIGVFAWVLCTQKPATGSSAAIVPSKTPVELPQPVTAPQAQVALDNPQAPLSATAAQESLPRNLAPAVSRWRTAENGRIKRFGDDVTVRYLTPSAATIQPASAVRTRQLSDDVTVRYIKPRDAVEREEPEGAAASPR